MYICMLLSYTMVNFDLFYDGAVDIKIWAPLTRSQCKVSDTQVTVKACGPLVFFFNQLKWKFFKKNKDVYICQRMQFNVFVAILFKEAVEFSLD